MGVTIKDVARAAGVSVSTVTRALASSPAVRPATHERVRRAATVLGYRTHQVVTEPISGRITNIGLVVPDLANPFFPSIVKGAQARAHEAGFAVFLVDSDEDPSAEPALVRRLAKQVDGILLCSPRMAEDELRALADGPPLVLVYRRVNQIPSVAVDIRDGMRQVVSHLSALGHQKIAYVAGPRSSWADRERIRSLRTAVAAARIGLIEIGSVEPQFSGGVAAADQVLASAATAVIAYNDLIAIGLLSRFMTRGVAVPGDISVVGFDDIDSAEMVHPPLTTVSTPKEQAGRAGVDLLLQVLQQPDGAGTARRELPSQLMVRSSTGPAPH